MTKTFIFLPMAISMVGAATIWRTIYDYQPEGAPQTGVLNAVLGFFDRAPVFWYGTSTLHLNSLMLMIILIWTQVGYSMVLLSAAVKSVPEDTVEAGRIDGAGERRIFFNIIVPQIWPTVITVFITVLIGVMKVFDVVYVTTNGAYNTDVIGRRFYDELYTQGNNGYASAIVVILLIAIIPVLIYQVRHFRQEEATDDHDNPARNRNPGRSRPTPSARANPAAAPAARPGQCASACSSCASPGWSLRSGCSSTRSVPGTTSSPPAGGRRSSTRSAPPGPSELQPGPDRDAAGIPMGEAFLNSFIVALPATVIPILIAAFAAYAFTFMKWRGRDLMFVVIVGLLVVPNQVAFVPLVKLYGASASTGPSWPYGSPTSGSGCLWPSTSCAPTCPDCLTPSSSPPRSTAPATSPRSGASSCRCPPPPSPRSRSSSSSGSGTTCSSR